MIRRKKPSQYARVKDKRIPRLDDGETVPRTGLYFLESNTRIIPVRKRKSKRSRSRE